MYKKQRKGKKQNQTKQDKVIREQKEKEPATKYNKVITKKRGKKKTSEAKQSKQTIGKKTTKTKKTATHGNSIKPNKQSNGIKHIKGGKEGQQ